MTARRLLWALPASLLVLATFVWYWLLHTESGFLWLWSRAQAATDNALQAEVIQGDLGSGLKIRELGFATKSTTLTVDSLQIVADFDLLPLQLQISNVVVDDVSVHISASTDDPNSKDLRSVLHNLSLPLSLHVQDATISNVNISGANIDNDVELSQISVAGALELAYPFPATINAELNGAASLTRLPEFETIRLQVEGDLDELEIDASSSPMEAAMQGSLAKLLDSPSWDIQLQLAETKMHFGENGTLVRLSDLRASSSGDLAHYSATVSTTLDTLDFAAAQFSAAGTGTKSSFDITAMDLDGADVSLSGSGGIAWGDNWSIDSQLAVAKFRPGALITAWPDEQPIRGELSMLLNKQQLLISDSHLTAGDSGMSAQINANIDLAASIVAAAVRWQDAKWPLTGESPTISSKSGDISLDGTVDEWQVLGEVDVGTATTPLGRLRVDGHGDRQHVEAAIVDGNVLGGTVSGYAAINWRDQRPWSAELQVASIELASFSEDWPSDVTGSVDASGELARNRLDLRFKNIDALFLDGPLSVNGQLTMNDDRFTASDLKIIHGDTRIELDGDPFGRSALSFDIAVVDVSRYLSEADGDLTANGTLSLHPEQPSLHVDASSSTFSYGDIQASEIRIVDQSGDKVAIDAVMTAEQISVYGEVIDNATIGLFADSEAQNLRFEGTIGNAKTNLSLVGEFDDLEQPEKWQGELREFGVAIAGGPTAELSDPSTLSLSKQAVTLQRGCIQSSTGMRLCTQLDWAERERLDVSAELTDIPVELVNSFVDTRLQFDQRVSGDFEWSQSAAAGRTGRGSFSSSAGTVTSDEFTDASIATDPGSLSFDIADGRLLSGTAAVSMPGFGHFLAEFAVPDIAAGADSSIQGLVDIDLTNMAVLATLSPLIDDASGEFRADLALSGVVSEPVIVGDMAVIDGGLTVVPIGLRIEDIKLASLLHENGQVEVSGNFLAGDGRGEIVTRADYSARGRSGFELELRGDNMTLIDTPNVSSRGDLDVRLAYDFEKLNLDGDILISHARVNPSNFAVASESESEDVVIVAGELPEDLQRPSQQKTTWISGSIGIEFGDDVTVDLGPATAKLVGKTVFSWEDSLVPIADGQYGVTGTVQAFGQVLEITEGGLRFPKIPANDPFVRIRAEREIYGNVQVKTAGILVDGTLRQFTIKPYTRPLTTEERALTLLVTGSDFDFEQGLGAIDFGTYIAPRVFVSYGLGLFETENVVRVRYDLNRSFGVTATSGEKESGIDLSYRIER